MQVHNPPTALCFWPQLAAHAEIKKGAVSLSHGPAGLGGSWMLFAMGAADSPQGVFDVLLWKRFSSPQPTIKQIVCHMPFCLANYTDNGVFLWPFHRTCLNTTLHCYYVRTAFRSELAGQLGGQKQLFKSNLYPFRKRCPCNIHYIFPGCFMQATPEVM